MRYLLLLFVIIMFNQGCVHSELRGYVKTSEDGGTYLVVQDDNGGDCGPMILDGEIWAHAIGQPGNISPGRHTLECGSNIEFEIKSGTTFHFNYWGP